MPVLADVIVKDLIANLPAASIPGRLFFATDTQVIMRDNGAAWDNVTPSGGSGTLVAPVEIDTDAVTTIGLKIKGSATPATIAFIQGASGGNNGDPSSVTFASNITVGSGIVVVIYNGNGISVVTDTLGNSYTLVSSSGNLFVYVAPTHQRARTLYQ